MRGGREGTGDGMMVGGMGWDGGRWWWLVGWLDPGTDRPGVGQVGLLVVPRWGGPAPVRRARGVEDASADIGCDHLRREGVRAAWGRGSGARGGRRAAGGTYSRRLTGQASTVLYPVQCSTRHSDSTTFCRCQHRVNVVGGSIRPIGGPAMSQHLGLARDPPPPSSSSSSSRSVLRGQARAFGLCGARV